MSEVKHTRLGPVLTIDECKLIAEFDPDVLFVYENNTLGSKIDYVLANPNWEWSVKPVPQYVEQD